MITGAELFEFDPGATSKNIAAGKMFLKLSEPHHVAIRRLAIRAAEFGPKADFSLGRWVKNPRKTHDPEISEVEKTRGH